MPSFGRYELAAELVRRIRGELWTRRARHVDSPSATGHDLGGARASGHGRTDPVNDLTASHASRLGRALATLIWLVGMLLVPLPATAAEAPTFAERLEGQHILDDARLISDAQEERLSGELQEFLAETGVDLVVYTRQLQPVGSLADARDQATELVVRLGRSVGRTGSAPRCSGTSTRRGTRLASASRLVASSRSGSTARTG